MFESYDVSILIFFLLKQRRKQPKQKISEYQRAQENKNHLYGQLWTYFAIFEALGT